MTQEKQFVAENVRRLDIETFLQKEFSRAGYSHTEIQRTPLSMRITIYAHKPGLIIGRGGKNIDMITDKLRKDFGFDNPQVDVQEVREPDLDPEIVGRQIASAIERGFNYKKIANMTVQRVMEAGAVGVALRIGGKLSGEMSRIEKFSAGYLKFSGDPAETLVKRSYATAKVKMGIIGIQVRILTELPKELTVMRKMEELTSAEVKLAVPKIEPDRKQEDAKVEAKIEENKEEAENGDNKEESNKGIE